MSNQAFIDRRSIVFSPATRRPATIVDVNDVPPQLIDSNGSKTWIVRAANFIVAITKAVAGTSLHRDGQIDEYMLYTPPGAGAEVSSRGERLAVEPDSLTIIPPGDSEIVALSAGVVFRIFSSRSRDLTELSSNAACYLGGLEEVAPLVDWPAPVEGYRLRTYPLKDVKSGEAFGRIYRSTNLMVNVFEPYASARDQSALSPHCHDDFEQGSLTITGRFEHYLRTPWGKDRAAWRDDLVAKCDSPSIAVIPAGMIHTTAWLGAQTRMIDIFSPPRADFSRQVGWVRNDRDYPAPIWIEAAQ
jgi:hypothetical protein